jgi:ribonuclease HI
MTKGWLVGWKKRGWLKSDKKPVLNRDLWEQLDQKTGGHTIAWKWVKGHAGNAHNERCDDLVHEAIDAGKLIEDSGYLDQQAHDPESFG